MKTLTELAKIYPTDKGFDFGRSHGYTDIYEDYFRSIRLIFKK